MRDFGRKLKLIWLILRDGYTSSTKENCWWFWSEPQIKVIFDNKEI